MDKSKFNPAWLQPSLYPEYQPWLQEIPNDSKSAYCNVCKKKFALSNMGKRAVTSHMSGQVHRSRIAATKNMVGISAFLRPTREQVATSSEVTSTVPVSSTSAVEVSTSAVEVSTPAVATSSKLGFLPSSDATEAELIWVIHVICTRESFSAQEGISKIFKKMFKDSRIASQMKLSRTKTAYLACFGLAPYFHHKLADDMKFAKHIVVCFDESFNRISKLLQMDLAVRFWDNNKNEVSSRFWNSSFLGHSSASDLLSGFKEGLGDAVELKKLVQVSMDGPNINWAFLELLKKDMKTCDEDTKIIDTGSCGLHVVHGAFQAAFRKTGWEIDKFLKSIYNVFKDSPARRADFVSETKCEDFPLKFCNCRWLENVSTCERAVKILPHLRAYFKSKSAQLPDTYSVKKSAEILQDRLLLPKLHFFLTIASGFHPFLTEFQTSKPMFPFLHTAVENLTREVMERFIDPNILEKARTAYKLINLDVENLENCLKLRQIKIGPAARQFLDEARVGEIDKKKYRLQAKNCLVQIVRKLTERSPLKYKFAKVSTCLDPKKILSKPEQCKTDFESCVGMLLMNNHVTALLSDRAILQFGRFAFHANKTELAKFDRNTSRLDHFFVKQMDGLQEYKDVWEIIKIILVFSHGNAFVEGGFSINKEMLVENLHEETLVALRRSWDGIQNAGGEDGIVIDQEMIRYARGACSKQKEAVEERKRKEAELVKLSRFQREEKKRMAEELSRLEKEKEELRIKQTQLEVKIKRLKK